MGQPFCYYLDNVELCYRETATVLACYRYIELNPVRADMVAHPRAYRWSSYRINAEGKASGLITPHREYLRLAKDSAERRAAYRALFRSEMEFGDHEGDPRRHHRRLRPGRQALPGADRGGAGASNVVCPLLLHDRDVQKQTLGTASTSAISSANMSPRPANRGDRYDARRPPIARVDTALIAAGRECPRHARAQHGPPVRGRWRYAPRPSLPAPAPPVDGPQRPAVRRSPPHV